VELWFAKIEREVISRGIFTSVKNLARKLMCYIRQYTKTPKTVKVMNQYGQLFPPPQTVLPATNGENINEVIIGR